MLVPSPSDAGNSILVAFQRLRLGVSLATGFVLAASARIIGVVDQNVIVACGADDSVYRLAKLLVCYSGGVFLASLFSTDRHLLRPEFSAAILSGMA
jgi:hypothetical protein